MVIHIFHVTHFVIKTSKLLLWQEVHYFEINGYYKKLSKKTKCVSKLKIHHKETLLSP